MSEMVERVAATLYVEAVAACGRENIAMPWSDLPTHDKLWWLNAARGAIGAMRKPTDAMVQTVRCARPYDMDITELWPIAIDEALR